MSLLLAILFGQATGKPIHPTHKPLGVDDAPVSAREAREAFARAAVLLVKVNGRSLGTPSIAALDRPVTRAEIVVEMARFYSAEEPVFRFTPAPSRHNPAHYKIEAAQKPSLDKLVTMGCVAPIGPLAVGPTSGLTASQFGDALGYFIARLAQMSHLPSPKWTPMLSNN